MSACLSEKKTLSNRTLCLTISLKLISDYHFNLGNDVTMQLAHPFTVSQKATSEWYATLGFDLIKHNPD